jgi:hypothetical protein
MAIVAISTINADVEYVLQLILYIRNKLQKEDLNVFLIKFHTAVMVIKTINAVVKSVLKDTAHILKNIEEKGSCALK